jgi:hypothetical protein
MQSSFKWLAGALLMSAANAFGMQHAILVQNSGWMEPFYVDAASQFRPLVAATADVVVGAADKAVVLAFNQSNGENVSPMLIYEGKTGPALRDALDKIRLANKGKSKAWADTDFNEAVFKTITGPFQQKPGILWIFTNNKNSPNNSGETAVRNLEFYRLIHAEPSIARSLAFPLSMPVKGNLYSANGLMVYALAYGTEASEHLQSLLASGRLKKVFTQQPAQLKPLDREAIRLVPKSVVNAPNTSAALGNDGKTLMLDIDVSHQQPVVQLVASMENRFYPYDIEAASIKAEIGGNGWANPLPLSMQTVPSLAPGATSDVTVSIPIRVELPDPWSPRALLDFGRTVVVPAKIVIRLDDQKLKVNSAFVSRLQTIFPGDPLPSVFVPPQTVQSSVEEIPLLVRIHYPLYPVMAALAALLALLGAGAFAATRSRSPRTYTVRVDGVTRRISVTPFGAASITDAQGKQIAVMRRRGSSPIVEQVAEGHAVEVV